MRDDPASDDASDSTSQTTDQTSTPATGASRTVRTRLMQLFGWPGPTPG